MRGRAMRASGRPPTKFHRVWDLRKNHLLFIFAGALVLFQLADAAMLPAISARLGHDHQNAAISSTLMMGILIIVPQIVVALLAPWVGYYSERFGRKPLLLVGLGAQALRAAVLALFDNYPAFVIAQLLDGISGAIIGVLTLLLIADITAGSGRFQPRSGHGRDHERHRGVVQHDGIRFSDRAIRRSYRFPRHGSGGCVVSIRRGGAVAGNQANQIRGLIPKIDRRPINSVYEPTQAVKR